jgi:hypothetical protein
MKKTMIMSGVVAAFALGATVATVSYAKDDKAAPKAAPQPAADKKVTPAGTPAAGAPAAAQPAKEAPKPVEQAPMNMPMPTPSEELKAVAKAMNGNWKCTGTVMGMDMKERPSTATMSFKLEVDGFWLRGEMAEKKTKDNAHPYKFTSLQTYDAATKKWMKFGFDNTGSWSKAWSTGPDATGKWTWEAVSTMAGMEFKGRDYEETKDKAVHVWGEGSMDGGKTYTKMYDITCKK